MSDYEQRLAALTPEQRKLLEQRLKQKGLNGERIAQTHLPVEDARPGNVPHSQAARVDTITIQQKSAHPPKPLQFSLIFFSDDGSKRTSNKYRAVLEAARFADQHGFTAVWIPERHLHPFGGLYPSPAVLGAALAQITQNVQIRAGSLVLPLHHPLQAVEEWAVVDNLSGGRVGLSFASGWVINDFIMARRPFEER
ncbi:MAG TPA: LLM class flavin-dependent oxidoreductase, partial [Ktedonobacteraceae bacterium]|nr:LLM class flavin-dependent oxidoreductase [Ktedonobacteraceae bacterium]